VRLRRSPLNEKLARKIKVRKVQIFPNLMKMPKKLPSSSRMVASVTIRTVLKVIFPFKDK